MRLDPRTGESHETRRCLAFLLSRGLTALLFGLLLGMSARAVPAPSFTEDGALTAPAAAALHALAGPWMDDPPIPPTNPNVLCPCAA